MPVVVIDTIKPKNNLTFPIVEDVDVLIKASSKRLSEVVATMATQADIEALQTAVNGKASQADLTALSTTVNGKQNALNTAQLTAVNSGITSELVTQIGTNTTAIASKASQSDLTALTATVATKANASDVATADASLQAQINAIVTPTTQDAEVQNARVSVEGTSFATLKSRLDSDSRSLSASIYANDKLYKSGLYTHDFRFENHAMDASGIVISTANSQRACTPDFYYIPYDAKFSITIAAGYNYTLYGYDKNFNFIKRNFTEAEPDIVYIRVLIFKGDVDITPTEAKEAFTLTLSFADDSIAKKTRNRNIFDATTSVDGFISNNSGTITSDASYKTTDFIPIQQGESIVISPRIRDFLAFDGILLDGMSVYKDFSFRKIQNTHNCTYSSGFSCSVVSDEAVDIAAFYGECNVVSGLFSFTVGF